jgi:DNA-binding transcriptional ArsR family regulator
MIIRACKVLASAIEAWKLPTNQFPRIATLAVNFPQQIDPQFHKALDSEVERILGVACQRELFSPAEAPNVAHDQHSETAGPGNQAGGAKGEGTKVEIRRAQIPALRSQSQHAKQESFVAELTKRFDVSRATIMGDLKALRREGKIPTTSKSAKTLTNHMHILNPTRGERV